MSRRMDADTGAIRYDSGPHPAPRKSVTRSEISIPIISETTIPSAAITTTTSTSVGPKVRDDGGMNPQSRQFLSPDVGYGYHPHSYHHQLHQGGGGGGSGGGSTGPGGTNLERVPSTNRLQPQSSTETSGLGETVTSGFSSQESVHSAANYNPGASTPTANDRHNPHPLDNDFHNRSLGAEHKPRSNPSPTNPASYRSRRYPEGRSLSPQEARLLVGQASSFSSTSPRHAPRNGSKQRGRERGRGEEDSEHTRSYGALRGGLDTEFSGSERTLVDEGERRENTRSSAGGGGGRERDSESRAWRETTGRRGGNSTAPDGGTDRASETTERGSGRPRAVGVGDIDRSAPPRARPRHGTATAAAAANAAVDRSSRSIDSAGSQAVHSPSQHPSSPGERERGEEHAESGGRNGNKVSASRREKDKSSARSSPKDKNGQRDKEKSVYRTSSRDSVVRSPEKSLSREGSKEGSNGRHRRDSSSSKRDSPVRKEYSSQQRQQEIYSLADNAGVRDPELVYGTKSTIGRDSKPFNSKDNDNGRDKSSTNSDLRRKEKPLERQKSRDSGIGRTLDRSQSREGPRDRPLEKQLSRDSGTGRSLEGQSPREPIRYDSSTRSTSQRGGSREGEGGELRNRSRTVDEVDTATRRDYSRDRVLPKHSSADSAISKPLRKVSRERTLERQASVDDTYHQDLEERRDNPFRSTSRDRGLDRPDSSDAARSNPRRSLSREKIFDKQNSADRRQDRSDRDSSAHRHLLRERTLDRQASVEDTRRSGFEERVNSQRPEASLDRDRPVAVSKEVHPRGNPQRRSSRERSVDRQSSVDDIRKATSADERRANPFRDNSRERSLEKRKSTDEIQLRELSTEERRAQRRNTRGEGTFERQSSVDENPTRQVDSVRGRNGGRSSRDTAYDRQTAGGEGNHRTSSTDRQPQRRFSRERTLDRQLSVDESRQIIRDDTDYDSSSRPQRSTEPQTRQSARPHRSEGRSETQAQIHGQSQLDTDPNRSVPRHGVRDSANRAPSRIQDFQGSGSDNRSAAVRREKRESDSQSVERRKTDSRPVQRPSERGAGTSSTLRQSTDIEAVTAGRPYARGRDSEGHPAQSKHKVLQESGATADYEHRGSRSRLESIEKHRADKHPASDDSKRRVADKHVAERIAKSRSDRTTTATTVPRTDVATARETERLASYKPSEGGALDSRDRRDRGDYSRPADRAERRGRDIASVRHDTGRPAHGGVQRVKAEERASVHSTDRTRESEQERKEQAASAREDLSLETDPLLEKERSPARQGRSRGLGTVEGQVQQPTEERKLVRREGDSTDRRDRASSIERRSRNRTERDRTNTEDRRSRQQGDRVVKDEPREKLDRGRDRAVDSRQGREAANRRLGTQDRTSRDEPDRGTPTKRTDDLSGHKSRLDGREGGGADRTTATTSGQADIVTMGSDGRQPHGQRQQPPRTIVTVTSPTSPENFNDVVFRPRTNGDVSQRGPRSSPQQRLPNTGREVVFDDLFSQARNVKDPGPGGGGITGVPGLQVEQINHEWERRESRGSLRSLRSRSSHGGSFRSGRSGSTRRTGRGLFLGVNTESAWTRWSRDRRASFRRRIELVDKPEENIARVSTPVRKARQEGLKFVHPDLEGTFLSEEDLNELRRHKQQKYHAIRVIEKNRKSKFRMKHEVHLTAEQWQVISDFWEHPAFVRGRYLGLFLMFVSFVVMVVSITHGNWVSYEAWNLTIYEGLWVNCSTPVLNTLGEETCVSTDGRGFSGGIWHNCYQNLSDPEAASRCPEKRPHWQNAVIGLMIFAASFGVLASVLSICGVCTTPLPRKIYYFHSAGEIFLICALSTGVALMVFPIAIEIDQNISSHRYGIGYGLGWGGAFFFLAAAVCMSLDDLVREASRAKCCKWCWKSKQNDRTELRQV